MYEHMSNTQWRRERESEKEGGGGREEGGRERETVIREEVIHLRGVGVHGRRWKGLERVDVL